MSVYDTFISLSFPYDSKEALDKRPFELSLFALFNSFLKPFFLNCGRETNVIKEFLFVYFIGGFMSFLRSLVRNYWILFVYGDCEPIDLNANSELSFPLRLSCNLFCLSSLSEEVNILFQSSEDRNLN